MKITAIKPFPVWVGHRNQLILKIETDEGLFGWGESGLSGREKAVVGALEHYAEFLIGRDPMRIGAIWQELYRSQYFEGGRVLLAAQSAIDIALHDIKAKALGVPVYELLGGKQRDHIPTFASTGSINGPATIEAAQALIARGWNAIRFFPAAWDHPENIFEPRQSIGPTAKFLTQARETLGDEVVLGIDYHHRLSVAETASFCQKMPSGTLDFLEEPIRDETPEAYEALRRLTDVPFAIGEEFASKWQFLPYIERDIHQFNRLDLCNVGGFTEAMKVAGWSEAHYVDMMPHNPLGPICTAATIHFSAAVANFAWLETRANATDLYSGTPTAE
ncbi:MAG TPA: mandelate racemase/muconate lactonizing enzyme family protein, partial [Devosia sp.]